MRQCEEERDRESITKQNIFSNFIYFSIFRHFHKQYKFYSSLTNSNIFSFFDHSYTKYGVDVIVLTEVPWLQLTDIQNKV